jgi:hypothetical protein
MIIWSGLGFLVPGISITCFLLMQMAMTSIFNDAKYYTEHGWPKFLACLVAAGLVGVAGFWLSQGRTYIDQNTGQEVIIRRSHSFFLIPVLYWAPIIAVFGLVLIFL